MTRDAHNIWLHRFALGTAAATLVLICFGGLVTSHGAGLSVPDWPNSYGYNMFLFPVSKWVGGIFYEHTHRLVASGIGLLTIILTVWLWRTEERRWLRWLGVAGLAAVIVQGVLGGLRVTLLKDELGIFHAALAQLFFVLVSAIALFTSPWWRRAEVPIENPGRRQPLRRLVALVTVLIFGQLLLGAAMRHQHAGLAIPDFPLAYGRLWPAMDATAIAGYNQQRLEASAAAPITAGGVAFQMAHRITALLIFCGVAVVAWRGRLKQSGSRWVSGFSRAWLLLICGQVALGAASIWSNKSADVATAHVAVGAVILVTGALFWLVLGRGKFVLKPAGISSTASANATEPRASLRPALS